jgi:hypothetical protein
LFRKSMIVLIAALLLASAAFQLRDDDDDNGVTAADAEIAARSWVGVGEAEGSRREGDVWEIDVRRPDGSMVQATSSSCAASTRSSVPPVHPPGTS